MIENKNCQTSNSTRYSTMWRSMMRVFKIEEDGVWLILPGWNHSCSVWFDNKIFPKDLIDKFKEDYMFFGYANIGVEDPRDLKIEGDFEYE